MNKGNQLTNEKLKHKFPSLFELANYGIKVAKQNIDQEKPLSLAVLIKELKELPDRE